MATVQEVQDVLSRVSSFMALLLDGTKVEVKSVDSDSSIVYRIVKRGRPKLLKGNITDFVFPNFSIKGVTQS